MRKWLWNLWGPREIWIGPGSDITAPWTGSLTCLFNPSFVEDLLCAGPYSKHCRYSNSQCSLSLLFYRENRNETHYYKNDAFNYKLDACFEEKIPASWEHVIFEPCVAWIDKEGFSGKVIFNLRHQGKKKVGEYFEQRESMNKGPEVGAASCIKCQSKPVRLCSKEGKGRERTWKEAGLGWNSQVCESHPEGFCHYPGRNKISLKSSK